MTLFLFLFSFFCLLAKVFAQCRKAPLSVAYTVVSKVKILFESVACCVSPCVTREILIVWKTSGWKATKKCLSVEEQERSKIKLAQVSLRHKNK